MKRCLDSRDRRGPSRRGFLGSLAGGSLAATVAPAGGLFAAGTERIRVGLIGCGGRGTGAARQAAAADPAVQIVALGDLFADQVSSSAHELARDAGGQFDCPPERRFVGERAYLDVLDAGVDLVLLAAPPHVRPLHVVAAVRAGKHLFCEKPAAIDLPGAHAVADACAAARRQKLAVVGGLCFRHDEPTRAAIGRIHDGAIGRVRLIRAHASIGLPWRKAVAAGWSPAACAIRNWISLPRYSGGPYVEHHIHALDRALWMLGEASPVAAVPDEPPHPGPLGAADGAVAVRYLFADGAEVRASCHRGAATTQVVDMAMGTTGTCDLTTPGRGSVPPGSGGMYQATINSLVRAVRSGTAVDGGLPLCHATLVAIMGRMAAETGRVIRWGDVIRRGLPDFPAGTIRSDMIAG